MRHAIARNVADGRHTMKFVARKVAVVERDSTATILHATISGVDTRCNLAIARNIACNIAPFVRALTPRNDAEYIFMHHLPIS